ncbi:N-acetylmuramoyl-L-alanine amidase [Bacillus sp. AFS094611]|uniref:GH25 family lysozyme n=1 Tax=Bacillus sp. AFS094611 TaxID=2033516 RepID=UPI000BEE72F3|nr:GH25 family lysozyme [Bacillus sp. AFS094611]PDZ49195.1 N-acetylmuramoyl-L-alanine amidase [Bacillus sp. AFS094611]
MRYIVDISKWNDKINWPVAAPQIELAICRVQYGSNLVDYLYNEHVTKLEQYGIPHAAYAYGCFVSIADAIVEAKDFLARVNPNAKFLVLDVEDDTVKAMKSKGNLNDLAKASQAFIDTCKAAGWKVGFYVAHHMYGDYNLQSVQADFIWLPRYGTNDGNPQKKPSYSCDIWQYTDNGYIDGIGKVDINSLQGVKRLEWYTGSSNKSYRINIGDFNELTWAGDTKRQVKELFPDYGIWDEKIKGAHRLFLGDFNSKEWCDETFAKLKECFPNYGMWIDEV